MKKRLLDNWILYAVLAAVCLAGGFREYWQLVHYERGEEIVIGSKIFALYEMTGKAGVLTLSFLITALFAWAAWHKFKTFRDIEQ